MAHAANKQRSHIAEPQRRRVVRQASSLSEAFMTCRLVKNWPLPEATPSWKLVEHTRRRIRSDLAERERETSRRFLREASSFSAPLRRIGISNGGRILFPKTINRLSLIRFNAP